MKIKRIKLENFKSFSKLDVSLKDFNTLIGGNASGKTNFLEIFRFIKDFSIYGLDEAISLQGGLKYFKNAIIGSKEDFRISFTLETDFRTGHLPKRNIEIITKEIDYDLILDFYKKKESIKNFKEKIIFKLKFISTEDEDNQNLSNIEEKVIDEGTLTIANEDNVIVITVSKLKKIKITKEEFAESIFTVGYLMRMMGEKTLKNKAKVKSKPKDIAKNQFFVFELFNLFNMKEFVPVGFPTNEIGIFDFDSNLVKKTIQIAGRAEFEESGRNLALVLNKILKDAKQKNKLINLLKRVLPYIDDIKIEEVAGKNLLFKLKDIYTKDLYLPSSLISNGTINILALIVALYFTNKKITIVEEPEKNIHPYLISKVIEMFKEVSKEKQIIITTHNPEILKYVSLNDILLVKRDNQGFTSISKPSNDEKVKSFLKNDIGIEDLFIQNILGV